MTATTKDAYGVQYKLRVLSSAELYLESGLIFVRIINGIGKFWNQPITLDDKGENNGFQVAIVEVMCL